MNEFSSLNHPRTFNIFLHRRRFKLCNALSWLIKNAVGKYGRHVPEIEIGKLWKSLKSRNEILVNIKIFVTSSWTIALSELLILTCKVQLLFPFEKFF